VASLFVIQGADQGKRFELSGDRPLALGRDGSNPIRLHDHEVSRRHAEVRPGAEFFQIVDLGSANGTFLNGRAIQRAPLRSGDQLRLGQTVMLFHEGTPVTDGDLTGRVDVLGKASPDDHSAIIRSVPADEVPDLTSGANWERVPPAYLAVLYQASQTISQIVDINILLPQILHLVFNSIAADRGAILLRDESGTLVPKAVHWHESAGTDERMKISRTIVDHVLDQGQGVITTDATADERFGPAQSIVHGGIREAICVPIRGRHSILGVLYADTRARSTLERAQNPSWNRFTQEHLMLMAAIGHQAGLAIENTALYQAKLQAERLAAVGQTIATLSHHIKNILQGIRGGSYLIDMGLNEKDEQIIRRGWTIVEKNQAKIYNLVMDMLSFSKDREPAWEDADLNQVVADVIELMQPRAQELHVGLVWRPAPDLPILTIDPEGIHRAVLNIVTNAIDATEDQPGARVEVATAWDAEASTATVAVTDNGVGIPDDDRDAIFQIFASTKGARGTGLGLPVSQKIIREHGGSIQVTSQPGQGTQFLITLPARRIDDKGTSGDLATLM
jgi:signal transduction histidine kinase